jgi:hypothetical protein
MYIALQIIGWVGSALLVISLLQSRMLALRVLNLIAAAVLVGYNAALLVWPMVAMNAAVAIIDIGHLIAIGRRRVQPAEEPASEPTSVALWT